MLWIALRFTTLPLELFTRAADEAGAIAVVATVSSRPIIAANANALAAGVRPGEPAAAALSKMPELRLLERNHDAEYALLEEIATWAYAFTPAISIATPDRLLLEVGACLKLFGSARALMQKLLQDIRPFGLSVDAACAPTPLAASWLTRAQDPPCVLPEPGWQGCLETLSCNVLALDNSVSAAKIEWLHRLGIRNIGQLQRLPAAGLARRKAAELLRVLGRARGDVADPQAWFQVPPRFASRIALPEPVTQSAPLMFAVSRQIQALQAWLTQRHAGIERCELVLEGANSSEQNRIELVTSRPVHEAQQLLTLVREHLAAQSLKSAVHALQLRADHTVKLHAQSQDLFDTRTHTRREAHDVIDRLRARLGQKAVSCVMPADDHRPEHAWQNAEPGKHIPYTPASEIPPFPSRPCWLLETPRRLDSIMHFELLRGPERIDYGWWDHAVRRDYFVARAPDQALWWIFTPHHRPAEWYVHGYFG